MFQVGVERWRGYLKKVFVLRLIKDKKLINFVLFQRINAFLTIFKVLKTIVK